MPPPYSKPIFVLAPGASQTPAHYGHLQHLLMQAGYGVVSGSLPSNGNKSPVSILDDAEYIRTRLILPVLDIEGHDVITLAHSYSSIPTSAAVAGLSKEERGKEGKSTSVLGQINLAGVITRGGDNVDLIGAFGGQAPPHLMFDKPENLIRCEDAGPPLFNDVEPTLRAAAVASCLCPSMTTFTSPCPRATYDAPGYEGRCAYIRTTNDQAIPYELQKMMLAGTGVEWITRDIDSGHSAQLAKPEDLTAILVELAEHLQSL